MRDRHRLAGAKGIALRTAAGPPGLRQPEKAIAGLNLALSNEIEKVIERLGTVITSS
jgi:hypothetical protein